MGNQKRAELHIETIELPETSERIRLLRIVLHRSQIDMGMVRELSNLLDRLEDDPQPGVLIFEGTGEKFCEGIDFAEFRPDAPMDIHGFHKWEQLCSRVERLARPTIARLKGPVVGGGLQLALCCDVRVADVGTSLQLDEVHKGFLPGMATYRLAKFIGLGRARRMILQARVISTEEALSWGLIDRVVAPQSSEHTSGLSPEVLAEVAAFGPAHPVAVQLARRLLDEGFGDTFEAAIGHFLAAQHRAISQSAFLETLAKARS
jgi:enoyl-CoA hydratase/carnithine racemase